MEGCKPLAWLPGVLALVLILAPTPSAGEMHTAAFNLTTTCSQRLTTLWSNYTAATSFPEGCDAQCLQACHATLQDAVYADNAKDCPNQQDIIRCFHVFSDSWEQYVSECELFSFIDPKAAAASSSEGEAGRRLLDSGTGSGAGCFPNFASPLDFELFIDGKYWGVNITEPSNTAGVILSVFFWVGLAATGFFMRG